MNAFPSNPNPGQDPDLPSKGEVPPEIPVTNPPNRSVPPKADHPGAGHPEPDPDDTLDGNQDTPDDQDADGFS